MININNFSKYETSISNLKETSFDGSNEEYMTESSLSVYNFDKVVKDYCKTRKIKKYTPSSADVFYQCKNNEVYLIEFKNGKIDKYEISKIKKKILESLLIITDILEIHISDTRENFNFIFVYNKEKNTSYEDIMQTVNDYAINDNSTTSFKLLKKIFFKEVFTLNKEEFENKFVEKWEAL